MKIFPQCDKLRRKEMIFKRLIMHLQKYAQKRNNIHNRISLIIRTIPLIFKKVAFKGDKAMP